MDKTIIIALMERIKTQCPGIQWVDVDTGQLNIQERPPVAMPACLIDLEYSSCEQVSKTTQQVSVSVRISIADYALAPTYVGAPKETQSTGLKILDITQELHECLQWWDNGRMWMPIRRLSVRPQKRDDGLKVYDAVYRLDYIDEQTPPTAAMTSSDTPDAAGRPEDAP